MPHRSCDFANFSLYFVSTQKAIGRVIIQIYQFVCIMSINFQKLTGHNLTSQAVSVRLCQTHTINQYKHYTQ